MEILKTALTEIQELAAQEKWDVKNIRVELACWDNAPEPILTIYVYLPDDITLNVSQKAEKSLEIAKMKLKAEYLNQF